MISIKDALERTRTQQGKEEISNKHVPTLMEQRRKMTSKNSEEYRKINREIIKEISNKRQENNKMIPK